MNEMAGVHHDGGVIPPSGLTVVVDPDKPTLDLVFIHGFTGHPERTWTHKRGDTRHPNENNENTVLAEPPSKIRKLNPFSNSNHRSGCNNAVYWPRDLVSATIPHARVLTYGYDTHLRHRFSPPITNTVYDIAWDFLIALEAERRLEPLRPILFVAHSLGGIVIKEMLRRSSGCNGGQIHLHGVFESTIGIIFFGTPHGGADPRGFLQHIAEALIKIAGVQINKQIVNTLLPSSERLKQLRDEFGPMAAQQSWIIHSFQEQLGVMALSGQKVVEDTSSYLNLPSIEISEHIGRNHMDMCRFTGLNDIEYKKVAAVLHRMTSSLSTKPRGADAPSLTQEQRQNLIDSLKFEQIDARQMTIKRAYAKTCQWLLKNPEYINWLDVTNLYDHHGFLWIKGKPGTGKSTMMKFILNNSQRKMKNKLIISFFFNARGENLEKSTIGMYRSLLVQLLERMPELQYVFESMGFTTYNSSNNYQWSVEQLKELFESAIQMLERSPVLCFIDALDECEEGQIRDMVTFFQQLGEQAASTGIQLQVCFASRHYPHITITKGLSLVLEGQEGHNQDMASYIDSNLKIGHSQVAKQIKLELQEKARGVFMWVVLVVDILNKEHDGGRIHALRQRLRDIPDDLHELFRDILTRDCNHKNELLICIQWLLFARRPLKPEELYFAILSSINPEEQLECVSENTTMETIKRFILNSSKGLAEITKSNSPVVQFIHESVRDFLLKEDGLRVVWSDLGSNFSGRSQEQLKQGCLTYMKIDIANHLETDAPLPKASSDEAAALRKTAHKAFPFLQYAVQNVLYHADVAERYGVSQKDFLGTFELSKWIYLDTLFQKHEIRRHTPNATGLYILAEHNTPNLIRIHPSPQSCFEVEAERYGAPLFAALATGSDEATRAFLEIQAEIHFPGSQLHEQCKQYTSKRTFFQRDFKFSQKVGLIRNILMSDDEILFNVLLESGQCMPDTYASGQTILWWAVCDGREAAVKQLIEKGVDANIDISKAALIATKRGYVKIVELLLGTGKVDVNIYSRAISNHTMLMEAALKGNDSIIKLLLETGKVDVNLKNDDSHTPLMLAARGGHHLVVKLLLETGKVDVNLKNDDSHTLLMLAARGGYDAIVKLLLDIGLVDINSKDGNRYTPLMQAAYSGRNAVVKVLLDTGKADVDAKGEAKYITGTGPRTGMTALMLAACKNHEGVVRLLIDEGKADVNLMDQIGWTALQWARYGGYKNIMEILRPLTRGDQDIQI